MGGCHTRAGAVTGPGVGSGARACMFRVHADVPTFGHLGEGVSVSHPVRAFVIKAVYTHTSKRHVKLLFASAIHA